MNLKNIKGITLVEALVAAIIASVLAAAGLTIFIMYSEQTRENAAMLRMQAQHETVAQEIARNTRNAALVLLDGESPGSVVCDTTRNDSVLVSATEIRMFNTISGMIAGYAIRNGMLYESTGTTAQLVPFVTGGAQVLLDTGSVFVLSSCRDAVELRLRVKTVDRTEYFLPPRQEKYRCRNSLSY